MWWLLWLFQFVFFLWQYQVAAHSSSTFSSSFSSSAYHLCPLDHGSALLQFKRTFTINSSASFSCDSLGSPSYPKMVYWNKNATDCCLWDGVTCDGATGQVIGLDLSCSQLYGTIHPNSTLFKLKHLQWLNLAYNDFNLSHIPSGFGQFTSLTHLNLSGSSLSGLIPSEISHLSKVVSLDLSWNVGLRLEPHNFKMVLQNLTQLQEVILFQVEISSVVPESLMNLSYLTSLDLGWTKLQGKFPDDIFHLPNLQRLVLFGNDDLTGNLPEVNWSSSSSLRKLDLSFTSLSVKLPDSIGFLKSLNYLHLSCCKIFGSILESLGNLTHIAILDLSGNNLTGQVPSTLSNLVELTTLDLSGNNLEGQIPNVFANLGKLRYLALENNNFHGQFPCGVANLTQLEILDISDNALTGPFPSNISGLPNLNGLFLSYNSLNGTMPSWLFSLPSLLQLGLNSNLLTGQIHELKHDSALEYIDLRNNELYGPIPQSISNFVNLTALYLSSNNMSGVVELDIFLSLKKLRRLDLSHNRLSVVTKSNVNTTLPNFSLFYLSSCSIDEFPCFLRTQRNLAALDLSNNKIHGFIPKWFRENGLGSLHVLDLSHNFFQGPAPVPIFTTSYFLISHNKFTGEVPSLICNASYLNILDLSHNSLSGVIPECLGNSSNFLSVLDLRMNSFHGTIPMTFAEGNNLRTVNLNGNQLEGPVPRSLANCRHMEVLDLGNNKLNDTFPYWLESLPELQVLVLQFNRFHGPIAISKAQQPFPKLRIFDLSQNEFSGHLPGRYFTNFKAMKNQTKPDQQYMGNKYYKDSVVVTLKGLEIELVRILTIFTTIDLSANKFEGEIPNIIGRLNSLVVLNLSHNNLTGHIPAFLGDLVMVESLDLSSNQLSGKIPSQLTSLTFLEVLNISRNHLVGPIPQGKQFDTFMNDSYAENLGLCGLPLSKKCEDNEALQPPLILQHEDDSDIESGFTWKVVLMGYGCGMVLGLFMGYHMFLTGRPKLFVRILEGEKHKKVKRLKKSGCRHGGRRN